MKSSTSDQQVKLSLAGIKFSGSKSMIVLSFLLGIFGTLLVSSLFKLSNPSTAGIYMITPGEGGGGGGTVASSTPKPKTPANTPTGNTPTTKTPTPQNPFPQGEPGTSTERQACLSGCSTVFQYNKSHGSTFSRNMAQFSNNSCVRSCNK